MFISPIADPCTEQQDVQPDCRNRGQGGGGGAAGDGRHHHLGAHGVHALQRTHARDLPARQEVAQTWG